MNKTINLSLAEVFVAVQNATDQVAELRKHDSLPLRQMIRLIFDRTIQWAVPNTAPPYKENWNRAESHFMLKREMRTIRMFLVGHGYDHLKQLKREQLFIQLLEDVHADDAKLLITALIGSGIDGISLQIAIEAMPNVMSTPFTNTTT